jgi:hypothetical protein
MEGQGTAGMTSDEHYILQILLLEINVFRNGGVVRLLDTPWLLNSLFRDSLLQLDHAYTPQIRPCGECQPFNFVSPSHDLEDVPCHHIFLNETRLTSEQPEDSYAQPRFEHVVTTWLRARIRGIKDTSH